MPCHVPSSTDGGGPIALSSRTSIATAHPPHTSTHHVVKSSSASCVNPTPSRVVVDPSSAMTIAISIAAFDDDALVPPHSPIGIDVILVVIVE